MPGYVFGGGSGGSTDLSGADLTPQYALLGKKFFAAGSANIQTGTMPTKVAATITPGTSDQVMSAGQYLSGDQTILGDSDLVAAKIKSGVSIFGVTGTWNIRFYTATVNASSETTLSGTVTVASGFSPYLISGVSHNTPISTNYRIGTFLFSNSLGLGQNYSGRATFLFNSNSLAHEDSGVVLTSLSLSGTTLTYSITSKSSKSFGNGNTYYLTFIGMA